ncbi:MAG: YIP1 family protein, partial [Thaumarchaeota archaeon]|nr:YIP1 family protein [Nitrososphaerota archaeon]
MKVSATASSGPTVGGSGMGSSKPPPAYSGANPMPSSFNIVGTFKHAIDLVRSPSSVMTAYKDSDNSVKSLMIHYVAVLAAVPFIATLIGDLWYYSLFGFLGFSRFFGAYAIGAAIFTYIGDLAAVFIAGFIIWKLAPNFGTQTTQARATRLAAYAFTPAFLIGILDIIPPLSFLTFLGLLYGLYILY